jgi:hypothetical protein
VKISQPFYLRYTFFMTESTVEREKVIELAKKMPPEKLASWYEYGLFIQSRFELDDDLRREFAQWEAASDEDWIMMEEKIERGT